MPYDHGEKAKTKGVDSVRTYPVGLVPGPVSVEKRHLDRYAENFGSADLEKDFFELYEAVEAQLKSFLLASNQSVVTMSGEGMLALWASLKSVLRPGDRVLCVVNGLFSEGFAEMSSSLGADVRSVCAAFNDIPDFEKVREEALSFRPSLITAVHCETPSGTVTPLEPLGRIARETGALLAVDFVSSAGGVELRVDDWGIDLGMLGSQKVLGILPDLAMVSVSEKAWERIERIAYAGYDALLPWRRCVEQGLFPYTHNWHSMSALHAALDDLLREGIKQAWKRHSETAAYCRKRLRDMGLSLYPRSEEISSPTVTAALLPEGWSFGRLDEALRQKGVVVGGNYGPLAGRVFRIGHMGTQASPEYVKRGLDILENVLNG